MTDEPRADAHEDDELPELPELPENDAAGAGLTDDDPMRALLRGAMTKEPPPAVNVLPGVQKKLRERSRGKFYGDGWSTAQQTTSYLLVAVLMLLVLGAAYYALGPMGIGR